MEVNSEPIDIDLVRIWLENFVLLGLVARTARCKINQGRLGVGLLENIMELAIKQFAENMQAKLDKNKHKECSEMNPDGKVRRWEHCNVYWLLYRLRKETLELEEALRCHMTHEQIMNEAADIGNFAMMIHDNASRLA